MARNYYSLLERIDGKWTIQFGDYVRQVVIDERNDQIAHVIEHVDNKPISKSFKIIRTGDKQADIQAEVDRLNNELTPLEQAAVEKRFFGGRNE